MAPIFSPFPDKPDHNALELEILELWEREGTFEKLRELNRGGPRFSFIDGPVTANKMLAVHTAWGRTLKDVFQRYKALQGFDQRYQNGFDCQGLWIEVGVERELGLNSKREIEEYGLAEFAHKCREKVTWSATVLTERSKRLGQWMDWGNDYFTFSDTNIEYIWRFLKLMHERGWLYKGHRSTEWCPRCGTSISQHELSQSGVYQDSDRPVALRPPPAPRPARRVLVIWTTTPWTLPANVAAAVKPDAEYGLRENGEWVAGRAVPGRAASFDVLPARSSSAFGTEAPSTTSARWGGRPPCDPVGRGLAGGGKRHRSHRSRRRAGGLRARQDPRPAGPVAGGRGRPLLRLVRLVARPLDRRRRPIRSSGGSRRPAS